MGIASLVLGIISLVFVIVPIFWFVGWIGALIGIIGIVLGALGRKKLKAEGQPTGAATAGMVMSIIGTTLSAIIFAVCAVGVAAASKEIQKDLNDPAKMKQLEEKLNKMKEDDK